MKLSEFAISYITILKELSELRTSPEEEAALNLLDKLDDYWDDMNETELTFVECHCIMDQYSTLDTSRTNLKNLFILHQVMCL